MRTLLIGATGMLMEAALTIARSSAAVTMVARTQRSLDRFRSALGVSDALLQMFAADWNDSEAFLDTLRAHALVDGPPDLVVAWLHDSDLGPRLAASVCKPHHKTVFVQVCGSMTPRRSTTEALVNQDTAKNLDYRRVLLGFVEECDTRRWLTHEEISRGVLLAIAQPGPELVIGELDG